MPSLSEVRAQLTGPGGMFEVTTEEVLGRPMQVYKDRMRSLREIPQAAIARGDEQTFIVHGDRTYGYRTFVETSNGVAHALAERCGVGHGDRVAVLSQNNPEWCLAFWATVSTGAILVGLNGWWKADEILYGLQDSGSKVLVADRKRFERIADRLDEAPDLAHVYLIDASPEDFPRSAGAKAELHRFDELTAEPTDRFPDTPIAEDDDAVIFYTSGTTGRPKGAISTHRSMIANLQNTLYTTVANAMADPEAGNMLGGGGPTVSLLTSPLFHVSGCHSGLVVGMLAGVKIVIPVGRFDPAEALRLIEEHGVTVWATVPTMVWRVCEYPGRHDYDTSTVTSVAFGGSPSAEELQRKIAETFPNVRSTSNAYGLTETSSVATVISGADAKRKPDSVGPPVPTVEVRIVDDDDNPLPTGRTGEVCIRGPIVMKGYWNKPEATAEAIDEEGWLHTGDIGFLDDEGFLTITDRKKDMIIRGGENVYCVEIENRLVEHPAIADAAVIGVPHPELGEEVKAVVQVEPGHTLTEDEVREWVRAELADFKVPAHVELRDEPLPRNASGKLLKNVLRGEGEVSFAETL
ncbi:MAG: class I adenylate-forming enzyme family protein [Thermoanaerobacterales bacterium]|jgi:long-chain acyl-CoA synthetase|nr:long-chain-fatty-acid--CoA ligase [Thermoanaerobacterales bacterium]